MSRSIVRSLVVGLAIVAAPAVVEAQSCAQADAGPNTTCTVNASASMTIPTIVNIALTGAPLTGADVALNMPTFDAAFLAGAATQYTETVVSLARRSNKQFDVTIVAGSANFTGPVGSSRSAGTLRWSLAATCVGTGTQLSTTPATVVDDAAAGSTTSDLCFSTEFTTDLGNGMMLAGAYSLDVDLTITAP